MNLFPPPLPLASRREWRKHRVAPVSSPPSAEEGVANRHGSESDGVGVRHVLPTTTLVRDPRELIRSEDVVDVLEELTCQRVYAPAEKVYEYGSRRTKRHDGHLEESLCGGPRS